MLRDVKMQHMVASGMLHHQNEYDAMRRMG